jgi:hypothetical protein
MRVIVCALFITHAPTAASPAQDPLVIAPQAYKLQFENDWVRVVRVHYAPLEKLPAHDHPKRRTIFIYLNDGGPVRFKHVEGYSGNYAAVRPPTKAGAFRLAGIQPENHEVENLSDLPSDFLQVELKTEAGDPKSFRGRSYPEPRAKQTAGNYRKVDFENEQVRITRLVCAARGECDRLEASPHPALLLALSPLHLTVAATGGDAPQLKLDPGQTRWLEAGGRGHWRGLNQAPAELLLIEFKSKPAATTGSPDKHKH